MTLALWIGIAAAIMVVVAHIALFLIFMGPDRTKDQAEDRESAPPEEDRQGHDRDKPDEAET